MQSLKSLIAVTAVSLLIFNCSAQAQRRVPRPTKANHVRETAAPQTNVRAAAAFETIKNTADVAERIALLQKFLEDFSGSELKNKGVEALIVSHVAAGEVDFQSGDQTAAASHFQAAAEAFEPIVSDNVFKDIVAKLPFNLFFRAKTADERFAAVKIARTIEPEVNQNPERLIAVANFYLATENARDAKRLAARAAELAPDSAAAELILGAANRVDLQLEAAAQNYGRALELDSNSIIARQNLADIRRGLGQNAAAFELYRELLAHDNTNEAARNGLILTLFNLGQKDAAEKELNQALAQNPRNLVLQTNVAYWYAASGDGAKAVEYGKKAVEIEPRYVWAKIALARGLMLEKQTLEAERVLVSAQQFGNFPTLDYELANARIAAGLYDEARDDLERSFKIENGKLVANLAGRTRVEANNFNQLLANERRASIFEFQSAASAEEVKKARELFDFAAALKQTDKSNETIVLQTAENFAEGDDEMRAHRQLYAASRLLNRRTAFPKIIEITESVVGNLDRSLNAPAASAAVLADELYEPRRIARVRGENVIVPIVGRETLSKILRGRIEEIVGWTLYQENKPDEAVIRLRRAVGILPADSAWSRSSLWKLGAVLEANGKQREALDVYIKSYRTDQPNQTRLATITQLYERVYGSRNGLEQRLRHAAQDSVAAQSSTVAPATTPARAQNPLYPARNPLPSVVARIGTKDEPTKNEAATKSDEATSETLKTEDSIAPQPSATIELPLETIKPEPTIAPSSKQPAPQTAETDAASEPVPIPAASPQPEIASPQSSETAAQPVPAPEKQVQIAPAIVVKDADTNAETSILTVKPIAQAAALPIPPAPTQNQAALTLPQPTGAAATIVAARPRVVIVPLNETATTNSKTTFVKITSAQPMSDSPQSKAIVSNRVAEKPVVAEAADSETAVASPSVPRVVISNLNGSTAATTKPQSNEPVRNAVCSMLVNENNLSLTRNGGSATLIVTFSDVANANKLIFTNSNPMNIKIAEESAIETSSLRRSFKVSSISETTRNFSILFESPCGKQEVGVKVR